MDVSKIIDLARDQTYTTEDQISDSKALDYLNIVYRDVINNIIEEDQGYFWQSATTDLEANVNEYRVPVDFDKVQDVYIKYEWAQYYEKADKRWFRELEEESDELNINQSKQRPIVVLSDNSIFIYPYSDVTVTDGIKITYIETPQNLALWNSTSDIEIPRQYHDVLWIGLKQYIFASRGMFEEKNNAFQEYSNMINKIRAYVTPRIQWPRFQQDINLDDLK